MAVFSELSADTGFARNKLDRMSEIREDKDILAGLQAATETRFVLVGRDRPILKRVEGGYDPFFTAAEAATLTRQRECVLLGRDAERAVFAILLDESMVDIIEVADEGGLIDTRTFVVPGRQDLFVHDLRALATEGSLPDHTIGLLGQAKSVRALAHATPLLRQLRRFNRNGGGRLAARMPVLQDASFSAHGSGGHHARCAWR